MALLLLCEQTAWGWTWAQQSKPRWTDHPTTPARYFCVSVAFAKSATAVCSSQAMLGKDCGGLVYGRNGGLQLGMQLLGEGRRARQAVQVALTLCVLCLPWVGADC